MYRRGGRFVRFTAMAAVVVLVGCSRFGVPSPSGGSPSGLPASSASASPGVPSDCGELTADACRKALDVAVRLVPPGEKLISAAITRWQGEVPDWCDDCPPYPADWLTGAELRLADRSPLELNCVTSFVPHRREADYLEADDLTVFEDETTVFCRPVDKAERRSGTLAYRVVNEASERLHFGERGVGGEGSMGVGGCSHPVDRTLPFSFYVARVGDRGYYEGGGWREVFRSEELGNRSGHFSFLITIHSFDDVTVEEIEDRDPC